MPDPEEILEINKRIIILETQMADLESRLPAHSIPPNFIAEIDRLDEEIQAEKKRLQEPEGEPHDA